jgi:hypothetical protein
VGHCDVGLFQAEWDVHQYHNRSGGELA